MIASSDWQHKYHNVKERNLHMLKHEIFTDCKFLVGPENDQKEIATHRLIMASASPVFERMFYGQLAETSKAIPIPDVRPQTFMIMLEYIYTDQINIKTIGNACGLYYLAVKYMLPDVAEKCTEFLCKNINEKNALRLYEISELFDLKILKDRCMEEIMRNTHNVISQSSFVDISMSTLMTILDQNTLNINSELDLFFALERYAKERVIFENENVNNLDQANAAATSDEFKTNFYDFYDDFDKDDDISKRTILKAKPLAKKMFSTSNSQKAGNIFQPQKELNLNFVKQTTNASLDLSNPKTQNNQELFTAPVFKFGNPNAKEIKIPSVLPAKQSITLEAFREAVKKIRFLTLTPQQFAEGPGISKLLTPSEQLAFFIIISKPFNPNTPVPEGFCKSFIKREKMLIKREKLEYVGDFAGIKLEM